MGMINVTGQRIFFKTKCSFAHPITKIDFTTVKYELGLGNGYFNWIKNFKYVFVSIYTSRNPSFKSNA